MAILAVVVALAVPTLHGFAAGHRVSYCADEIARLAQWARTQAMARGMTYRLYLDPSARQYQVKMVLDDGTVTTLGEDFGQLFKAPEEVTRLAWNAPQHQDGQYIEFSPNGRSEPAKIIIYGPNGQVFQVACFSATELYHLETADELAQNL